MSLLDTVETKNIPSGQIARHPRCQRATSKAMEEQLLKRFQRKLGEFDLSKALQPLHVVPTYGADKRPGVKYWAVNGATNNELCVRSKQYGPKILRECRVYGNGAPPSDAELDELFLLTNTAHVSVGSSVAFDRSVGAGRPSAVAANKVKEMLGLRFRGVTGLWKSVEKFGEDMVTESVDFVLSTWPNDERLPSAFVKACIVIWADAEKRTVIKKRRRAISHKTPEHWYAYAKTKMLSQVGQRDTLGFWLERTLLGKHM